MKRMNLLLKRNVSYGPFVISDGVVIDIISDPLSPCEHFYDVRTILRQLGNVHNVDFVVFRVGEKIVKVLATSSSRSAQHGRALFVNLPGYKHDLLTLVCGSIGSVLAITAVVLFVLG